MSDDLDDISVIRMNLQGLITRDCEVDYSDEGRAAREAFWNSPEEVAKRAARERGDLKMISLSSPGAFRWLEVDRAGLRALRAEGWSFDAKTEAWADEPDPEPAP